MAKKNRTISLSSWYYHPLKNLGSISVPVFLPDFPLKSGFHFQRLLTCLIICVCIPQWKGVLRYILCDFEANFLRTNWNNSKAQSFYRKCQACTLWHFTFWYPAFLISMHKILTWIRIYRIFGLFTFERFSTVNIIGAPS